MEEGMEEPGTPTFRQITAGNGELYALDMEGRVWLYDLDNAAWVRLPVKEFKRPEKLRMVGKDIPPPPSPFTR